MKLYKIPFISGLGRTKGCEKAPGVIEKLLKKQGLEFIDVSVDINNIRESNKKISQIKFDEENILLGGDHSISYPAVKAFFKENKDACLVVFDAHADLMPSMKEQTHEDWLRKLVDEQIISARQVFLVGLRNVEPEEKEFIKQNKIRAFFMENFSSLADLGDNIMEFSRIFKNTYISIDIDAIDSVFVPGVSCPEPGGFSSREFLALIKRIFLLKCIKTLDIVELNPEKDINNNTSILVTKIINLFSERKK